MDDGSTVIPAAEGLQALGPAEALALHRACHDAVHVFKGDGELLRAGKASLFILTQTRWPRLGALAAHRPFIWFVELGYWILARNRMLFSRVMFKQRR